MPKIGLKLWSTNIGYISTARELFTRDLFDYIELFIAPGSTETIPKWKGLGIPYVLHAPHSAVGLNLGDKLHRGANLELVRQVDDFLAVLLPAFVIFHPGVGKDLDESVLQFRSLESKFPAMYQKILIENKPQVGLRKERCLGASPEEMRFLLESTQRGFCLDFGHVICYSVAAGKDWKNVVADFLRLKPVMYHLCDGFFSAKDTHEHLGDGEFDLLYLIGLIGLDARITLETKKNNFKCENSGSSCSLQDFVEDVEFINKVVSARGILLENKYFLM